VIQTAKALKTFLSSFGLPAYTIDTVPKEVELPYITYPLTEPEWNQKASFYVQGWFQTRSNTELLEKADEIVAAIGTGLTIEIPDGYLVLYPDTPLIQLLVDDDTRSFYINLSINSYHLPGV
jgi:hypothetical protein